MIQIGLDVSGLDPSWRSGVMGTRDDVVFFLNGVRGSVAGSTIGSRLWELFYW